MTADTAAPAPPVPSLVGFIGLGMMGARVASRLQSQGVPLIVHNRDAAKAAPLVAGGARLAERPSAVGRAVGVGVTFLMLTDGPAVSRVLFGRGGLARGLARGATVVDLSTIDPEESRRFATRLADRGVTYLDAPVGGSIGPAERGDLTLFVGGAPEAVEGVRPLLSMIARRIEPMGPTGAGAATKLVNNLLTIDTVAMISEAVALGEAFELPRDRLVAVLRSGGGASTMLESKQANFVDRAYAPAFLLPLARKDLRLIERATKRLGRSAAITREARRLLDAAIALGHERDDFSSVFEAVRARPTSQPVSGASPSGDGSGRADPP